MIKTQSTTENTTPKTDNTMTNEHTYFNNNLKYQWPPFPNQKTQSD